MFPRICPIQRRNRSRSMLCSLPIASSPRSFTTPCAAITNSFSASRSHLHFHPTRLRHLLLAVLRERTDHHGLALYHLSAKASSLAPRRRLQRLPSRRPKLRILGLHPRPLRTPSLEDALP